MDNLRLSLRSLIRAPGFTAAAVLVLAIGVGGSTAVFSVLRGVVLHPLGLPEPEQLVRIYMRPSGKDFRWPSSGPDFKDLEADPGAFSSIAGVRAEKRTLIGRGPPRQVPMARVTANFFSTLRVFPAQGRGPAAGEDFAGVELTAVLTDGFWRREFGGDPAAIGKTLTIDGKTYAIGGVMPPDFRFPLLRQAEVLLPLAMEGTEKDFRGTYWLSIFGRLQPGKSLREAQAHLDVITPRLFAKIGEHAGWHMEADPLLEDLVGPVKPALTALLGAVLLALLIACANVASLLLARGMARQRELAIRAALGGGRGALIRHVMTEAMLLAAIGGGLGVLLAPWALSALLALAPPDMPRLEEVRLDAGVLAFSLLATMLAGVGAGLLPAVQLTRPQLMDVLKNTSGGTAKRARARAMLVVGETALAFVLTAGAGLMIRTLAVLLEQPTGLAAPHQVLVADVDPPQALYPSARVVTFARELVQRASAIPGVKSATLTTTVPLDPRGKAEFGFRLEGETYQPGQAPTAEMVWATPGYLETMGVPLLRGRDLGWGDVDSAPHVVLVNEAFVKQLLPEGGEPLGRRISEMLGPGKDPWTIAGVIGDARTMGLDRAPRPLIVVPMLQYPWPVMRIALRATAGDARLLVGPLRAEVAALDKDVPVSAPRLLDGIVNASVGEKRFQMTLLTIFALVALTLAALGIYGVMAYSVVQRSREIGIRMALGAAPARVVGMVVSGGLRLGLCGVLIGAGAALLGTRALASLVYQVSTTDPATMAITAAALLGATLLASWLPARRATRVDPAVSLRAE